MALTALLMAAMQIMGMFSSTTLLDRCDGVGRKCLEL